MNVTRAETFQMNLTQEPFKLGWFIILEFPITNENKSEVPLIRNWYYINCEKWIKIIKWRKTDEKWDFDTESNFMNNLTESSFQAFS